NKLAVGGEFQKFMIKIDHIHITSGIDRDSVRFLKLALAVAGRSECRHKVSVRVEFFDTIIALVGYIDIAFTVSADAPRLGKFTRAAARATCKGIDTSHLCRIRRIRARRQLSPRIRCADGFRDLKYL